MFIFTLLLYLLLSDTKENVAHVFSFWLSVTLLSTTMFHSFFNDVCCCLLQVGKKSNDDNQENMLLLLCHLTSRYVKVC